jgi:hypothetical protein
VVLGQTGGIRDPLLRTQIEGAGSETNGPLSGFLENSIHAWQVHFYCIRTVVNSMGVMTPPSSVAGVRNLCGFTYKDYGTNAHVKIHRVHMYIRSRGFDTTIHPTFSAVGYTPYIFEGIVLLYLGGQE